jgi:hypothetical protein
MKAHKGSGCGPLRGAPAQNTPAIPVPARGMVSMDSFDVLQDSDSLVVNASAAGTTVMGFDRYPHL